MHDKPTLRSSWTVKNPSQAGGKNLFVRAAVGSTVRPADTAVSPPQHLDEKTADTVPAAGAYLSYNDLAKCSAAALPTSVLLNTQQWQFWAPKSNSRAANDPFSDEQATKLVVTRFSSRYGKAAAGRVRVLTERDDATVCIPNGSHHSWNSIVQAFSQKRPLLTTFFFFLVHLDGKVKRTSSG